MLYFVSSTIGRQIEKTILISTDKAVEICEMQIREAINASKTASYNQTIRDSYLQYCLDGKRHVLSNAITGFLNQQYKYEISYFCSMVFLLQEPDKVYYTYNTYLYNNIVNSGYERVLAFQNYAMEEVLAMSEDLDTRLEIRMIKGRLYVVRNLVNSTFEPYGMIVIELVPKSIMDSLNSVWGSLDYEVYVDSVPMFGSSFAKEFDQKVLSEKVKNGERGYVNEKELSYSYKKIIRHNQEFLFLVNLDTQTLIDDVSVLRSVVFLVVIFLIPLVILVFRFFYKKVTKPVAALVEASGKIKEGNYGILVGESGNSQEFEYLEQSFNKMSCELKHQFEQIYLEELALKDANIMALQSQINPHFLNNTLEIINWEARMSGNEKVSSMIEALATMLNATMNRKQKRMIPLAEELSYVDAYLFIIRQRFGERFCVERDIDESLYPIEVPMLIIQPIVENAVEHGVNGQKKVIVRLHIYRKEDTLYIKIRNNKALSEADEQRILHLLGNNIQNQKEHHVSLGIRNVDRRLKIIYGEECGLTIKNDQKDETVSTLIIKIDKENNKSQ